MPEFADECVSSNAGNNGARSATTSGQHTSGYESMRIVQCFACGVEFKTSSVERVLCADPKCTYQRKRKQETVKKPISPAEIEAHRKKDRERAKEWYALNAERRKEDSRRRYSANPEYWKERYRANRDKKLRVWAAVLLCQLGKFYEQRQRYYLEEKAAVETFRQLVGPCSTKDRFIIKKLLQQFVKEDHSNAAS